MLVPQHLWVLGPNPISCLDNFKNLLYGLLSSCALLIPPLGGALWTTTCYLHCLSWTWRPPHSRGKPWLSSLGLKVPVPITQPNQLPPFCVPSCLQTSAHALSDGCNAFPAVPTPDFMPHLFIFLPDTKSPSWPASAPISELLHTWPIHTTISTGDKSYGPRSNLSVPLTCSLPPHQAFTTRNLSDQMLGIQS